MGNRNILPFAAIFPVWWIHVAIFFTVKNVGKIYTRSSHGNPSWDFSSLQPAAFHAVEASDFRVTGGEAG